jgi:hypothetical protein
LPEGTPDPHVLAWSAAENMPGEEIKDQVVVFLPFRG